MKTTVKLEMKPQKRTSVLKSFRINYFLCLLALPACALIFIFSYMPMYGILIAFKDFNISKGILGSEWVGLKNFRFFFESGDFNRIMFNTLFLNTLFIVSGTIFGLLNALLLNEIKHKYFKRVAQSIIILPFFMSWIVISMLVTALLGGDQSVINHGLLALGFP